MIRVHFFKEKERTARIPVTFYSQVGKKRLIKIWNAHKLSNQLLFASLTNNSNESAIREKVTDYMQNYLHACMTLQRSTLRRKAHDYIYQRLTGIDHDPISNQLELIPSKNLSAPVSTILERKQTIIALREDFHERCVLDEEKFTRRQLLPSCGAQDTRPEEIPTSLTTWTTSASDDTADAEAESVTNDLTSHAHDSKAQLPLRSRSSSLAADVTTTSITQTQTQKSKTSISIESDDDGWDDGKEQDSLYDDCNERKVADSLLQIMERISSDEDAAEQQCEISDKNKKLTNASPNNIVGFGWIGSKHVTVNDVFKQQSIEEIRNVAEQILKFNEREMEFADEFSEKLEILLKSKL